MTGFTIVPWLWSGMYGRTFSVAPAIGAFVPSATSMVQVLLPLIGGPGSEDRSETVS